MSTLDELKKAWEQEAEAKAMKTLRAGVSREKMQVIEDSCFRALVIGSAVVRFLRRPAVAVRLDKVEARRAVREIEKMIVEDYGEDYGAAA